MEGIICLISCLMCAFPLFVMGYYNKNSKEPIIFWAGDKSLKEKVKNIKEYNLEMARLYMNCALAFVITGVVCLLFVWAGIVLILLECTVGIYVVWRLYKKILSRYV